jgi:hypothetical protein
LHLSDKTIVLAEDNNGHPFTESSTEGRYELSLENVDAWQFCGCRSDGSNGLGTGSRVHGCGIGGCFRIADFD